MTIKQKILVYFGLAALLAIILIIWGVFAFHGMADRQQFVSQLSGFATLIIAALSALGGFHARAGAGAGAGATADVPTSISVAVRPDSAPKPVSVGAPPQRTPA